MTTPEDNRKRAASSITMPEGTQTEAFYNKSEFLRIEDVARDFYAPDLHNNIDPMYHEKNFANDVEYKYIEMSARLATRYLTTAETWSAIDKIVNTGQKDLIKLEEKNDLGQNHYAYPSVSRLTLAARQQGVQNALARVAETVRFLLASATDLSGSTADTAYVETVPRGAQSGKPQWHSEIRLDKQSYKELVSLTKSQDDPQGKLVVFPWPNNTTWNVYKGRGINRRPHVRLPRVDLVWRVDVHQLASHFRTSTWNRVAQSGITALRLDRTSAHGFWQDPTDKFQVLHICNPRRANVPDDYEVREYGDVMWTYDVPRVVSTYTYRDESTDEPDSPLSDEDQSVEPPDDSTDSDETSNESNYDPMDTDE
ncbi:hypothetical protein LTR48_007171 [Friedmanniomyces endolithicus]|uniref:HNH nuclease domain-containing protein n=1 Tax=Rachicladosporium monterosium TaxID=1507873 RepID=A0ABR0KWZ7_9PEZI|nr:hypothetical protein LTR48_007171 [Friedmanniomyces endolithicus]KAK5139886.1 hypothetical protein LTR32_007146 [Rachicladosporium monterosium]